MPRLILASRSPRRAQLLREAGFVFTQADPPFDDPPQPAGAAGQSVEDLAGQLAGQKAMSLRGHVPADSVILAADTICVGMDDELIGQPKDRDDAERMIRHFMQQTHGVVTGAALLTHNMDTPQILTDRTDVTLGALSDVQLAEYLNTDGWRGKAGGYNLFDRQADGWPLMIEGDDTTVVGLPMQKIVPALKALGVMPEST